MTKLINTLAAISLSLSVMCAAHRLQARAGSHKSSSKVHRTSVNHQTSTWNWRHNDSNVDLSRHIRGTVEIPPDGLRRHKAISDGGYIPRER